LSFIDESVENDVIRVFADSMSISPEEVSYQVSGSPQNPSITLRGTKQMKDETITAEITISMQDRGTFAFTGNIEYQGKVPRGRQINQVFKGSPEALHEMLRKILIKARLKKKGFLSGYFG